MKFYLALIIGKITNLLIKYFYPGSGGTWPGHMALKIDTQFLSHSKIHYPKGIFVVSGTNGKTTTAKILSHILENNNLKVTHNRSGGNILNGIASAIIKDLPLFSKLDKDVAVFEVDELHMVLLLNHITPTSLILLNLSRDQLDRYGEIDIVLDKWKNSIRKLPAFTNLILDSTNQHLKSLADASLGKVFYFDANMANLNKTSLYGEFNAKNVNAAITALQNSQLNIEVTDEILSSFEAAYGRGELLTYKNKFYQVFLAKNPASFNYNLETILNNPGHIAPDTLFFILNDEVRDGHDVSWIYDVNPELLNAVCANKQIYISGTRYLDMAIRLKYAKVVVPKQNLNHNINVTLENISLAHNSNSVLVLPNYSGMLNFRKVTLGKDIL